MNWYSIILQDADGNEVREVRIQAVDHRHALRLWEQAWGHELTADRRISIFETPPWPDLPNKRKFSVSEAAWTNIVRRIEELEGRSNG